MIKELTSQDRWMRRHSRSWKPEFNEDGQLCDMDVSGWIQTEFQSAEFGNKRLADRIVQLGDELGSSPAESIPAACGDWASRKATCRFCDNDSVDHNEVLSAHEQQQQSRVSRSDELLIVSDTTKLVFPRHLSKEGLGDIGNAEMDLKGIKLHSTIEINPRTHRMTGVIDQQALVEKQQADQKHGAIAKAEPIQFGSEHEKWSRATSKPETGLPTMSAHCSLMTVAQIHSPSTRESPERWKFLELRELACGDSSASPVSPLSEAERTILGTKFSTLSDQDGKSYTVSVAKLGGYIDCGSDPPPR